MANCNRQQLNITCGTDVELRDFLMFDGEVFDPTLSEDVEANLVNSLGKRTPLTAVPVDNYLAITIEWDDNRNAGCYGLEVKGVCNERRWSTYADALIRYTRATVEGAAEVEVESDYYDVTQVVGFRYTNSPIEHVNVDVDDNYGEPEAVTNYDGRNLDMSFKNLRGNGIANIEQTTESQVPDGVNETTITQDNGNTTVVRVRNGKSIVGPKGQTGDSAVFDPSTGNISEMKQGTGDNALSPMSQKAITEMYEEEELYEGWGYTGSKYIKDNDTVGSGTAYAYTDYIPLLSLGADDRLVANNLKVNTAASPSWHAVNYYNADKQVITSAHLNTASINVAKRKMPEGTAYVRMNYTNQTYPTIKFVRCGKKRIEDAEKRLDAIDCQQVIASVNRNKYIDSSDGSLVTDNRFSSTDFIELIGAKAVHSSEGNLRSVGNTFGQISSSVATIAFYDSNKAFISNSAAHFKYAECPAGAAYIRCTVPLAATSTTITLYGAVSNSQIEALSEAVGKVSTAIATGLEGKRVAFIGDSITERSGFNDAYHKVFADLMGCTNINLGMNATTIANHPTNNMGSNRFITRATSENLSNVDMVVIFGGTNDFTYDSKPIGDLFVEEAITPTGDIGSKRLVAPTDIDTFAGALHELILQVRSIIGEKPIVLMTPLNRGRYGTGKPTTREANTQGNYLMDFVNAIKEIGRFYGIPVFDSGGVMNFDPTDRNSSSYSGDLLHPNTAGHYRLGNLLYKWVCQNIFIN